MQGRQAGIRLLWKIGRGFLASSHAGTRLPIAVLPARAQGAPPQPAPGGPRGAGCCFRRCITDLKCPFIINQNSYNIFNRTIEQNGLKQAARECQKGIISFSPLAQGMLTDRYINGIPEDSRIKTDGRFLNQEKLTPHIEQIKKLNDIATKRGETLAQMALKWVVKDDDVTSVLVGASKPQQILENLKVMEGTGFSEEELRMIDEVVGV